MKYSEIQIWGDSIMKGVVFDEARGRYALLKESAAKALGDMLCVPVKNYSQMCRTAPQGLEALARAEENLENKLVILEFGGNDCDFDWAQVAQAPEKAHLCHTPASAFTQALQQLVNLVRQRGGTPVLCTLPPLNAERYLSWITRSGLSRENILAYIGQPQRIYRWQEYYSALVVRAAAQLGCPCLPVREAFLENLKDEDVWCLDGIHPNRQGHKLMAGAMAEFAATLA